MLAEFPKSFQGEILNGPGGRCFKTANGETAEDLDDKRITAVGEHGAVQKLRGSVAPAYQHLISSTCHFSMVLTPTRRSLTEGFAERLTGRSVAENVGPCSPVVHNFFEDSRFLLLTRKFWTLPWLGSPCQLD